MRLLTRTAILAGLAAFCGSAVQAADLRPYGARRHRRPPIVDEKPVQQLYTRPVVGFYGYPYDYAIPSPARHGGTIRGAEEPYILRRDAPHGVDVY